MVTTRSKITQTHLEDFRTTKSTPKKSQRPKATKSSPSKANISRKRKTSELLSSEEKPKAKRTKSTASKLPASRDGEDSKITINRAPVLQLWSACVTHSVYPELDWKTCLSAGSAISTICAVAKGRSIGTVPEKDVSEEKKKKKQDAKKNQKDLENIEVMHFNLRLKDGLALVGSGDAKGKPGNEEAVKKKFGDEEYQKVRIAFEKALGSWKGEEEELSKKAFEFYEKFRPDVKSGQKGWGRKGELSLEKVREVVER
ncbi:Nn.00g011470.m01.CDS01 [Neocucurbitaria sp. VM-36]